MNLKELQNLSNKMLSNFINEIGLNGDFYISSYSTPITWGRPKFNSCGEFVPPYSNRLNQLLQNVKYSENQKNILNQKGLILINKNYKQSTTDPNLFVTIIHETIHSNRNLLIFDAVRNKKNEFAYSFNNNKFEQNTNEYNFSYADASQDILKEHIDTSRKSFDKYKKSHISDELDLIEDKKDLQMEKQQIIDESLVELISILSFKLYNSKENNKKTDIWNEINNIKDVYIDDDIGTMCEIILKHHDFELFNWILDPITFSYGDIHYDFFTQYTKNDQLLLQKLFEVSELDLNSIIGLANSNEICLEDIKEIAVSPIAFDELLNSLSDIKNAFNYKKDKNQEMIK